MVFVSARERLSSILGLHVLMLAELLSLLVVLTLGVLSPGPDFLVVLKNSVGQSRIHAFATVAGIAVGLAVQLTIIAVGFTVATPAVWRGIQLGGAAFLAWIGMRTLWSARAAVPTTPGAPSGDRRRSALLEGLGCNLANPKAFLFYVSMFAQLMKPDVSPMGRGWLPVIFVAHAALMWSLVVLALQSPPVARRLTRAQRWLPLVFGLVLLAQAGWVAWPAVRAG